MKLKSKTWSRIVFRINPLSGIINKNFDPKDLNDKVSINEIECVLRKIEYDTDNFQFLRYYTHWKYIILGTISVLLIIVILLYGVFRLWNWGIALTIVIFLLSLILTYLATRVFKNESIKLNRIIKDNIHLANELFYLKKRLYMMACNEFKFIAIYIIPIGINLSAIIHNIYIDKTSSKKIEEEGPSQQVFLNDTQPKISGKYYMNFKNNFITDFNI